MREPDEIGRLQQTLADLLVTFRKAAGLSQQALAGRIGYGRTHISNAENRHRVASPEFWDACDHALCADGRLRRAYDQIATARVDRDRDLALRRRAHHQARAQAWQGGQGAGPEHSVDVAGLDLRGRSGGDVGPAAVAVAAVGPATTDLSAASGNLSASVVCSSPTARDPHARAVGTSEPGIAWRVWPAGSVPLVEVLVHLRRYWHVLVAADNLLGPAHALRAVHGQIALIESLLPAASGSARADLLGLGAQYAESAGWLWEDAGRPREAAEWTNRALEWAHAADDPRLMTWALFRRSQQAAAQFDVARTLGLLHAAHRAADDLPAPMLAALAQQTAVGLALGGDERGCQTHLDKALAFAAADDVTGEARSGHGSFCTASYIELQRANCWMRLGQPTRAASAYRTAVAGLPAAYRRDRAYGLARSARALLAMGEVEAAGDAALDAARLAAGSGSARTTAEIRAVTTELRNERAAEVAALLEAVAPTEVSPVDGTG